MLDLLLSAVFLSAASLGDGIITRLCIEEGDIEVDPLAVFVFGTKKPTDFDIFVKGMGVILSEIVIAFTLAHFHPGLEKWLAFGGVIQAGVHTYEIARNITVYEGSID